MTRHTIPAETVRSIMRRAIALGVLFGLTAVTAFLMSAHMVGITSSAMALVCAAVAAWMYAKRRDGIQRRR